jgi:serralysin
MATVTLSAAFNTENLWAPRLAGASLKTSTVYEFQSAFGFVRVTGTNFTYGVGEVITGGDYTSILVATNNTFSTPIASYSSGTSHDLAFFFTNGSSDGFQFADTINGSTGKDTITSHGGGDTLDGKEGSDIYVVDSSDIGPSWSLDDTGVGGTDTLRLGNGSNFTFTASSVSGIEALVFTGNVAATFLADQLAGTALSVRGDDGHQNVVVVVGATSFSAAAWSFTKWNSTTSTLTSDFLQITGTSAADTLIGSNRVDQISGSGDDDVLAGLGGKDFMNGGTGADTFDYNRTSHSKRGAQHDVIFSFSGNGGELDQIDLLGIDAKKGHGNQAFHWIGAHKFHHKAGELQVKYNGSTEVAIVQGDVNGDGKADFQIEVHSTAALGPADFIF